MADSTKAPIKDALKVIMTEQDTLGAAVGLKEFCNSEYKWHF